MADEEELKAMILSFRVSELHMLLSFAGRSRSGRKSELQARAIELLQIGSYPVILKIKNLYKSIQQLSNSGSGDSITQENENAQPDGNSCDTSTDRPEKENGTNLSQRNYGAQSYGQQSINQDRAADVYNSSIYQHSYALKPNSQMRASHYPVHPDVKLKKLPFYEVAAELLKPSSLVPLLDTRVQENTFVFHLTPQQATAIGLSRDLRSGSKADYSVQGQLRFCLLETTSEQEDCFPPGIMVKINNKVCQLPNPIPTNKIGVEPKRPPRPVNITHLMKISPTVGNTVHVQWTYDYTRRFVVAVYLVHKKTSEDLLNRLKAKGVRGADYTRGMIKDKLNEDADSEIATTSLRVSLICPLGKMRMRTPCRPSTCHHLQCFDASLFLQMNERKPTWTCPVCDKPALYDKLVIDGYFQEVLSSSKLPPEGNEIQLHSDGSWSSHTVKKEPTSVGDQMDSNIVKVESKVETVQVDVDDVKSVPEPKKDVPHSSKEVTSAKRKVEEIDLTVSDSDDEPLIIHKKKTESCFSEYSVPAHSPPRIQTPSPNDLLSTENSLPPSVENNMFPCKSPLNFAVDMPDV
ncbi:UNVERIFIED_CONTAM: hypothetical protein PYX00_002321 [Menopon gallinae]|uniref:E3 SUMO-protein ligase PIAS2 n=1 Tax=Menopon gallinae TaxID=328185 RepID=A0AAW2IHN8_9NEOP